MPDTSERRRSSLEMLAPTFLERETGERLHKIPLEQIVANKLQVRTEFSDSSIEELAATIESHGLLEPIVVRRIAESPTVGLSEVSSPERYELIAGERRFRA